MILALQTDEIFWPEKDHCSLNDRPEWAKKRALEIAKTKAKAKQETEEAKPAPKAEEVCKPPEWSKEKKGEDQQKLIQTETAQSGSVSFHLVCYSVWL